jgi:hypothetical protein
MLFDLAIIMAFGTAPIGLAAVGVLIWEFIDNRKEHSDE